MPAHDDIDVEQEAAFSVLLRGAVRGILRQLQIVLGPDRRGRVFADPAEARGRPVPPAA